MNKKRSVELIILIVFAAVTLVPLSVISILLWAFISSQFRDVESEMYV